MNNILFKKSISDYSCINVPLILKVLDWLFFMRAKHIIGYFEGVFDVAKTLQTP
jgi:hypothetical protein